LVSHFDIYRCVFYGGRYSTRHDHTSADFEIFTFNTRSGVLFFLLFICLGILLSSEGFKHDQRVLRLRFDFVSLLFISWDEDLVLNFLLIFAF
jgi:hypothetical protein